MSDEEVTVETSDGQILSAEYKDGQLQIVEVTPFDKDRGSILPDLTDGEDHESKYMQVLDPSGKGLVHLDLLNLTLVRCQDGEEGYQLVANAAPSDGEMSSDATVTCVLQTSDTEVIFFPSRALLASSRSRGRGRKRKSDLPPPHELLASPNFKLYLYSCKLCSFKCNAVKDMSAHKAREHTVGGTRGRAGSGRGAAVTLQCARCPYRASTHSQLMKHVQDKHLENHPVHLNTEEVEAADVLVCGACGFESGSRSVFRKHIEEEHGATTC
ncbi:hypothetical protein HW555_005607 [Spodoptera exigua]|uniref:C2H2-type domain-containing protein n=1 Tax=Spodoptera exigua TaxID=7107 RepID=A0A835L5C0_SPOEX|nr:hypothetical protein HW555_005607 [Spodoptera exigua]